MNRLTHPRNNGIKSGYWSPNKKDDLIERLAAYENTGLEPEQIYEMDEMYREKCVELAEEKQKRIPMKPKYETLGTFCEECLCAACRNRVQCSTLEGDTDQYCKDTCRGEVCCMENCSQFEKDEGRYT